MCADDTFSKRHGFQQEADGPLIHHDAPEEIRMGVLSILEQKLRKSPSWMRGVICARLRKRPNPDNWSNYPNIWGEVQDLLENTDWYKVYDIIEDFFEALPEEDQEHYEKLINDLFEEQGIGWRLRGGELVIISSSSYEEAISVAEKTVADNSLDTAAGELREALRDLSRRPSPDVSGAIQHATAALEAVARRLSGREKLTLGQIAAKHADLFPPPMDEVVQKLWGYASEQARHGREERELNFADVQLAVGVCAVLCNHLIESRG